MALLVGTGVAAGVEAGVAVLEAQTPALLVPEPDTKPLAAVQ